MNAENEPAAIELQLFATLRRFLPANASAFPIAAGSTVAALVASLGIASSEAKLIFIDGRRAELHQRLHGGERVGIFPPVGGG